MTWYPEEGSVGWCIRLHSLNPRMSAGIVLERFNQAQTVCDDKQWSLVVLVVRSSSDSIEGSGRFRREDGAFVW